MHVQELIKKYADNKLLLKPEYKQIRQIIKRTDDWVNRVSELTLEVAPKIQLKKDLFSKWIEQQLKKSIDPLHEETHAKRVTSLMRFIAEQEGLQKRLCQETMTIAGMAHDIGRSEFISVWKIGIFFKALRDEMHSVQKIKTFFEKDVRQEIPLKIQQAMQAIKSTTVLKYYFGYSDDASEEIKLIGNLISDADNLEIISKARIAQAMHRSTLSSKEAFFVHTSKSMCLKYIVPRIPNCLHFDSSKDMFRVMVADTLAFLEKTDKQHHQDFKRALPSHFLQTN